MATISSQERKTFSHKETKNTLDEFPLLDQIRNATREKVSSLLWGTLDRVGQWFRNKIDKHLPGLLTPPEKKVTLPQSSLYETDEDTRQRERMGQDFARLLNQYRKDSRLNEFETDDQLMSLAEKVAGFQVDQGAVKHTSDTYRRQNDIADEILVSGFSSPQEAMNTFIESATHYPSLMGSYKKMGYAIRPGVEKKTGQTMYYLVVLFRNGEKADTSKIQKKLVPENPPAELETLEQALENKPGLKPYFSALETQSKNQEFPFTFSFDKERTRQLPSAEKRAGVFFLTFSKDGRKFSYTVTNSPARLNRLNSEKKLHTVRFEEAANDLKRLVETLEKSTQAAQAQVKKDNTRQGEVHDDDTDLKKAKVTKPDSPKQ